MTTNMSPTPLWLRLPAMKCCPNVCILLPAWLLAVPFAPPGGCQDGLLRVLQRRGRRRGLELRPALRRRLAGSMLLRGAARGRV